MLIVKESWLMHQRNEEMQLLSHATFTFHNAPAQIFVHFDTLVHTVIGWNFSPKLISVPPRLLDSVEYVEKHGQTDVKVEIVFFKWKCSYQYRTVFIFHVFLWIHFRTCGYMFKNRENCWSTQCHYLECFHWWHGAIIRSFKCLLCKGKIWYCFSCESL